MHRLKAENGKLKGSAGGMVFGQKKPQGFQPLRNAEIFWERERDNVGTHRMRPITARMKRETGGGKD